MIKPSLVDYNLLKPKPKPIKKIIPKTLPELINERRNNRRMYINISICLLIILAGILLYYRKQDKEKRIQEYNQNVTHLYNLVNHK